MESYIICQLCGEKNSTNFSYCRECGGELAKKKDSLDLHFSYINEISAQERFDDSLDALDKPERVTLRTVFSVQKSGGFETTYKIEYFGGSSFITAERSAINRIDVYLIFIIPFLFYLSPIGGFLGNIVFDLFFTFPFLVFLFNPFFFIVILAVLFNLFIFIRRISIYGADRSELGILRGNLFFTRWKIKDFSGLQETRLNFSLMQGKGVIQTPSAYLIVKSLGNSSVVHDSSNNHYFTVSSLDSQYIRSRFRIESSGQLSPLLTCLASICIIERFYKPQSEPGSGCDCGCD